MHKKTNCSAIFLIFIAWNTIAQTQDRDVIKQYPQKVNTVIKSNPAAIIWGVIPFTAEYRYLEELTVGLRQSTQFGVSYLGKSIVLKILEDSLRKYRNYHFMVHGFRLQVAHRFYLSKKYFSPRGYYVSPQISYATARFTTSYYNQYNMYVQGTHFNLNILGGYQAFLSKRLILDMFAGIGYKKNHWEKHLAQTQIAPVDLSKFPQPYHWDVKITFGFNLGWTY